MHWDLKLKPNEYWSMDFEEWHTAMAVQGAYREGAESAVEEHRKAQEKQAERERKNQESQARLKEKMGA